MKILVILTMLLTLSCEPQQHKPATICFTVYSGGKEIAKYKGFHDGHTSVDAYFVDEQKGSVRVRGDWVSEPCQ